MRKLADREKKVLTALMATETINSGATFNDADGVIKGKFGVYSDKGFQVEVKATDTKGFRVTDVLFNKIQQQAFANGRVAALAISLPEHDLVVLELKHFRDLLDKIIDLNTLTEEQKLKIDTLVGVFL